MNLVIAQGLCYVGKHEFGRGDHQGMVPSGSPGHKRGSPAAPPICRGRLA
jgi:hypothetical protein